MNPSIERLTFICTSAPWHPGPRARILPLAAHAAARGVAVTVLCLDPAFAQHPRIQVQDTGVTVMNVAQMHIGADGAPFTGVWLWWMVLRATGALTFAALHSRPDALVIAKSQPMNGIAGLIVGACRRIPVLLDTDDDEAGSHTHAHPFVVRALSWFARRLPGWVTSTTCATQWQTNQIVKIGNVRVSAIPNGVTAQQCTSPTQAALEAFRRQQNLPAAYVVYIGNWSMRAHAVDLLIRAYAASERRLPLVLAGSGHDRSVLCALAESLGIGETVVWIETLSPAEVILLMAGARASIDPIRDTPAAAARCPLKIIESIAQGIPVITSPVGDRQALLGTAGIYATAGDVDSYAEAIDYACTQHDSGVELPRLGAAFRWDILATRWYRAHKLMLPEVAHAR